MISAITKKHRWLLVLRAVLMRRRLTRRNDRRDAQLESAEKKQRGEYALFYQRWEKTSYLH